jgi:toxin FitB
MTVPDTNVLSEALKPSPSEAVLRGCRTKSELPYSPPQFMLVEVLYGIEVLPQGKRRSRLLGVIERLLAEEFEDRIRPFDEDAARLFPKIIVDRQTAGRSIAQFDAMIASIARLGCDPQYRRLRALRGASDQSLD